MERNRPCPQPLRGCPYDYPFADDHHKFWPGCDYTTATEKRFRSLEVNIVRGMCRCLHNLEHLKKPPRKPSVEQMREAIDGAKAKPMSDYDARVAGQMSLDDERKFVPVEVVIEEVGKAAVAFSVRSPEDLADLGKKAYAEGNDNGYTKPPTHTTDI